MSNYKTHIEGDKAVITLGRNVIGGADALSFSSQISDIVAAGARRLVVDLSAVELINSSGLGMLAQGLTLLRKSGGTFVLAAVPERARKQLDITRLSSVLASFPTVEEALAGE